MFGGFFFRIFSIWENLEVFFLLLIVIVIIYLGDKVMFSFFFFRYSVSIKNIIFNGSSWIDEIIVYDCF